MSLFFKVEVLSVEGCFSRIRLTKMHPDATDLNIHFEPTTGRIYEEADGLNTGYNKAEAHRLLARTLATATVDNVIREEFPDALLWAENADLPFLKDVKVVLWEQIHLPSLFLSGNSETETTLRKFMLDVDWSRELTTQYAEDEQSHELFWEQVTFELEVIEKRYLSHIKTGLSYETPAHSI